VPLESGGITVVTPHFVRTSHGRGMKVEPWTIDDPTEMQRLVEMGVDGIITDYPDRLLEVLGR
jgi:glycerophosphoryl diester phosphodiesterase